MQSFEFNVFSEQVFRPFEIYWFQIINFGTTSLNLMTARPKFNEMIIFAQSLIFLELLIYWDAVNKYLDIFYACNCDYFTPSKMANHK